MPTFGSGCPCALARAKATVGRLVLGSGELRELRDRAKTAVYVSSKQEISMRGQEEMAQAVQLVDAILDARRAA